MHTLPSTRRGTLCLQRCSDPSYGLLSFIASAFDVNTKLLYQTDWIDSFTAMAWSFDGSILLRAAISFYSSIHRLEGDTWNSSSISKKLMIRYWLVVAPSRKKQHSNLCPSPRQVTLLAVAAIDLSRAHLIARGSILSHKTACSTESRISRRTISSSILVHTLRLDSEIIFIAPRVIASRFVQAEKLFGSVSSLHTPLTGYLTGLRTCFNGMISSGFWMCNQSP